MARALSFEADIHDAMVALDLALKGADAADASLEAHARTGANLQAINFPLQEGLLSEAAGLMKTWQARVGKLVTDLDAATEVAGLHYRQLFDTHAGEESRPSRFRRVSFSRPTPEQIAADLKAVLAASASLEHTLKGLAPVALRRHKSGEAHVIRIIERRRHLDFAIEEAQRQADALVPRIAARQQRIGAVLNAERLASIEEEHRGLVAERQSLLTREAELTPERETLRRLIAIYETFVESLNADARFLNRMKAKLEIDIEQGVALIKAVLASASSPAGALPEAVAGLIDAYDRNPVAGYRLADRKAQADAAFAARPRPAPVEVAADDAGEAPAEASSGAE